MNPQESDLFSSSQHQSNYIESSQISNKSIQSSSMFQPLYHFNPTNGTNPSPVDLQYGSQMSFQSLLNTPMANNPVTTSQNIVNTPMTGTHIPIYTQMNNSQTLGNTPITGIQIPVATQMTNTQNHVTTPPTNVQNQRAPKGSKRKVKDTHASSCKKDWTIEEEVALTNAWLNISMDPIVGNNQKTTAMWVRIHQVWKESMGSECKILRSSNSLQCHWSTIHAAVNNFVGHYSKLERHPQSGTNTEDLIRKAMGMYEDIEGSIFKWVHCWEIMIKNPKWYSKHDKKTTADTQIVGNSNSPTNEDSLTNTIGDTLAYDGTHDSGIERPQGRKGSQDRKRRLLLEKGMVDALNKLQCTMEKQVNINATGWEIRKQNAERDLQLKEQVMNKELEMKMKDQRRRRQERIMNQDLSKLTSTAKAFYEDMQTKILKEWANDDLFEATTA